MKGKKEEGKGGRILPKFKKFASNLGNVFMDIELKKKTEKEYGQVIWHISISYTEIDSAMRENWEGISNTPHFTEMTF